MLIQSGGGPRERYMLTETLNDYINNVETADGVQFESIASMSDFTSWVTDGFYANVNPEVSHPRWSQARERRLPTSIFSRNYVETLKFNGYESQVAHLYKNMDLLNKNK